MSDGATSYAGSQAFNQNLGTSEYVNNATGELTLRVSLASLRGVTDLIPCQLSLMYAASFPGALGFSAGWQLDLPYVLPGASLFLSGVTYLIDPDWSSASGHFSGLRYENNDGIQFSPVIPNQPLPTNGDLYYAYRLSVVDGTQFFFDSLGKLLLRQDRYGNAIAYDYADPEAGPLDTTLEAIQDSFGQTIGIVQQDTMTVTLPDQSSVSVLLSTQGVEQITDAVGQVTLFTYGTSPQGEAVIQTIAYASGLQTELSYGDIMANGESGPLYFPAVASLTHSDGSTVLDQTRYTYGSNTGGRTFTGAQLGLIYSSATDCLMDSSHADYQYDCLVERLDASGAVLSAGCTYFNYLHLAAQLDEYGVDEHGVLSSSPLRRSSFAYALSDDLSQLSASYTQPVQVDGYVWSPAQSSFLQRSRTTTDYNGFVQVVASTQSTCPTPGADLVQQSSRTYGYQTVTWPGGGSSMLVSQLDQDLLTGGQKQVDRTLTSDLLAVAGETTRFDQGSGALQPWKTRNFQYDGSGRLIASEVSWTDGEAHDGVASASNRYAYAFDADSALLTVTLTDAVGNSSESAYRCDIRDGALSRFTDAGGNVTQTTRDALGRVVQVIDARGNATTTQYSSLGTGTYNGWAVSTPMGYVQTHVCDALGRVLVLQDNCSYEGGESTRVLLSRTLNALGLVASETDVRGLATHYAYDAFSRPTSRVDPLGNATQFAYADDQGEITATLNGAPFRHFVQDGLGRTTLQAAYPGDDASLEPVAWASTYGGFGQLLSTAYGIYAAQTGTIEAPLRNQTVAYDCELNRVAVQQQSLPAPSAYLADRYARDLLGNLLRRDTTLTYPDGSTFQSSSDQSEFDASGRLCAVTLSGGGQKNFAYDAAGRLASTTDVDGTVVAYQYDAAGNLVSIAAPETEITASYDADGRLAATAEAQTTMQFELAADGLPLGVAFGDGRQQRYARDASGRIATSTDAAGTLTQLSYADNGLVDQLAFGATTVTPQYGLAGGVNGKLTGETLGTDWQRYFDYDGYGRLSTIQTLGPGQHVETEQQYDVFSQLVGLARNSAQGARAWAYEYDPLGQVTAEARTSGGGPTSLAYAYDGASNIISLVENEQPTRFQYGPDDELQLPGISFDGRGNMLADDAGNRYTYDGLNRLLTITLASGAVISLAYYPNGLLASSTEGSCTTRYYYDGGQCNAIEQADAAATDWASFLLTDRRRLAAADSDGGVSFYERAHGSTIALFGDQNEEFDYTAYGNPVDAGEQSLAAAFGWKQELTVPGTQLVYLRARFYHPALMRFMSADQYVIDNRYVFGLGDPINRFDPTGRVSASLFVVNVVSVLTGIAGVVLAPFTGGGSLAIALGVTGGVLGAVSGGLGIAGAVTHNKAVTTASWIIGVAGAIASAGSAGVSAYSMATKTAPAEIEMVDLGARPQGGGAAASVGESGEASASTGRGALVESSESVGSHTSVESVPEPAGTAAPGGEGAANGEPVPAQTPSFASASSLPSVSDSYFPPSSLSMSTGSLGSSDGFLASSEASEFYDAAEPVRLSSSAPLNGPAANANLPGTIVLSRSWPGWPLK